MRKMRRQLQPHVYLYVVTIRRTRCSTVHSVLCALYSIYVYVSMQYIIPQIAPLSPSPRFELYGVNIVLVRK